MNSDSALGCIAVFGALCTVAYFVFWSRRQIDRIGHSGFGSARKILKELNDDR